MKQLLFIYNPHAGKAPSAANGWERLWSVLCRRGLSGDTASHHRSKGCDPRRAGGSALL